MAELFPIGGREVPVAILLEANGAPVLIQSTGTGNTLDQKVILRLGTRVSDNFPSSMGFRAMLRTKSATAQPVDTMEESYHVMSFAFNPHNNQIMHGSSSAKNMSILKELFPSVAAMAPLHEVNFLAQAGFKCARFGEAPDISDAAIELAQNDLELLKGPVRMALYFPHDPVLEDIIDRVIAASCKGDRGVAWSDTLPASVEPTWNVNIQDQMVEGSTGPVNALRSLLREPLLSDGPSTKEADRKVATIFNSCLREIFPRIPTHFSQPCLPTLINVKGVCTELPFGGSMINPDNVKATVLLIRHLVINFRLPPASIGVVAFYPSQADLYRKELQAMDESHPEKGYRDIQVDALDNWAGKVIDIAILDIVRTSNAGGNLGLLSQHRRLKVALTRHKNGLVLVGDRTCTKNAEGKVTSSKLEKVLAWFDDNRRIVSGDLLSRTPKTMAGSAAPITEKPDPKDNVVSGRDFTDPSVQPAPIFTIPEFPALTLGNAKVPLDRARRYVGIPELERDLRKLQLPRSNTQPPKPPISNTNPQSSKLAVPSPVKAEPDRSKVYSLQELKAAQFRLPQNSLVSGSSLAQPSPTLEQMGSKTSSSTPVKVQSQSAPDAKKPEPAAFRFNWPSREEEPSAQESLAGMRSKAPSVKEQPVAAHLGNTLSSDSRSPHVREPVAKGQSALRAMNINSRTSRPIPNPWVAASTTTPEPRQKQIAEPTSKPRLIDPNASKPSGPTISLLGESLYGRQTTTGSRETSTPKKGNVTLPVTQKNVLPSTAKKENVPTMASTNPFSTPTFKPEIQVTNTFSKPAAQQSTDNEPKKASPPTSQGKLSSLAPLSTPVPNNIDFAKKHVQRRDNMESILKTLPMNARLSQTTYWHKAEDGLLALKQAFLQQDPKRFDETHAKLCTTLGNLMGIAGK